MSELAARYSLAGRTALVTGCRHESGRAAALSLAASGADIIGVSASLGPAAGHPHQQRRQVTNKPIRIKRLRLPTLQDTFRATGIRSRIHRTFPDVASAPREAPTPPGPHRVAVDDDAIAATQAVSVPRSRRDTVSGGCG